MRVVSLEEVMSQLSGSGDERTSRPQPTAEAVQMELRQRAAAYLRARDALSWPSPGDWVRALPGCHYRAAGEVGVVVEVNTASLMREDGQRWQVRVMMHVGDGTYVPLWFEAGVLQILADKPVTMRD